jgi:hypothetical protein
MSFSDIVEVFNEVGISFAAIQPPNSSCFISTSSLGKVPVIQIEAITQTDLKMKIHLKVCLVFSCLLFFGLQKFIPSAPKFLYSSQWHIP